MREMASTRLTQDAREQIATAVLLHRFQEPVDALVVDRAAFAEEVYNDIYRKSDREKMAALPKGWLPETNAINVQFGDQRGYESLQFSGKLYSRLGSLRSKDDGKSIERRAFSKNVHSCVKVYEPDHRLSLKHDALDQRYTELKAEFEAAERQVKAALNSATTINKLVEMWPEVEPFVRKFDASPLKVPSIPTDQLNKLLDLPVAA
jgi:hypothetical protein